MESNHRSGRDRIGEGPQGKAPPLWSTDITRDLMTRAPRALLPVHEARNVGADRALEFSHFPFGTRRSAPVECDFIADRWVVRCSRRSVPRAPSRIRTTDPPLLVRGPGLRASLD